MDPRDLIWWSLCALAVQANLAAFAGLFLLFLRVKVGLRTVQRERTVRVESISDVFSPEVA